MDISDRVRSSVGNMSDCRYMSDSISMGHRFHPGSVRTLVEIDHEIMSKAILLPSPDSRRVFVRY